MPRTFTFSAAARGGLLICSFLYTLFLTGQSCGDAPVFTDGASQGLSFLAVDTVRGETNTAEYFGSRVAISGNYAIVSAYEASESGASEENSDDIYFYERSKGKWEQVQRIRRFGKDYVDQIAISGEYAFITDSYYQVPGNEEERIGRVYIYRRNASGTWDQTQILEGSDDSPGPVGEYFGEVMHVADGFIAVHYGGPKRSSNIPKSIVRIFSLQDGRWEYHSTFQGMDTPYSKFEDNNNNASNFGFTGTRIIADMVWGQQAFDPSTSVGRVAFEYNSATGTWEDTFVFPDGAYDAAPPNNITFESEALALQDDLAVFTTTQWFSTGGSSYSGQTGPTWVYQRNQDGSWTRSGDLTQSGYNFLESIALSENYLLGLDNSTLYAYAYDGNGQFTQIGAVDEPSPSQNVYEEFGEFAIDGGSAIVEYFRYYEDDFEDYDLPSSAVFFDFSRAFDLNPVEVTACESVAYQPAVSSGCAVTVSTATDLAAAGAYDVRWTAVDAAGNRATATQRVTVTDASVSLPFTARFNEPEAPACWTADPAWTFEGGYVLDPSGAQTDENRLALPSLRLESGKTYGFAFQYQAMNPDGGGRLRVVGPTGDLFDDASAPAELQYVQILFPVPADGTYAFSFQSPRDQMDAGLRVSEVSVWEYAAPADNGAGLLAGQGDGTCLTVTAQGVAGQGWQRVLTPEGALLAEINANGNDLGDVEVGLADYADAPTAPFTGAPQLGRYYSMQPGNGKGPYPANGGVRIRLYVTDAELDELETASGQSLAWENLAVTHYSGANDDCDLLNSSDAEFATEAVTATGDYGTTAHYVEFTTQTFSEFGLTYQQAVGITPPGAQPLSGLDAFPNPTGDRVTVRLTTDYNGTVRLRLTDLLGRPVRTAILEARPGNNDLPLDLTGLPAGTYHVHAVAGSRAGTLRILKR